MQQWKLTQIFINLPPQKQVVAGLTFTALVLGFSISTVVVHYESILSEMRADKKVDDKQHLELLRYKDSQYVASQNRNIDFMEREIIRRYEFKDQLDSLKNAKKERK